MKIGFIGAGRMGRPMVARLVLLAALPHGSAASRVLDILAAVDIP